MPYNDLQDEDLVSVLANRLSDYEFEMLVRERIRRNFNKHLIANQNLDESHNYCVFKFNWDDKSIWNVAIGGSYNDRVDLKGEVLAITLDDCSEMWKRQNKNKLSLLLPG